MSPSNLNSNGLTKTTEFFSNYFKPSLELTQNINDSILSFFQTQTGDVESAKLLVQAIIETAQAQREDPLVVLQKFQNMPNGDLTALLALYLNTSRVSTSYLGIKKTPRQNQYVQRTIIQ